MRKTINNVKIEGKVYDHSLKTGVSKTGKNYVMGELQIQVSDTNTVPVRFIEMETSSLGNENKKYKTLVNLMNTVVTVSNAKEGQEPTCVSIWCFNFSSLKNIQLMELLKQTSAKLFNLEDLLM